MFFKKIILKSGLLSWVIILLAFGISSFGTLFLWNFWSNGTRVLGVNSTLFSFLIIGFFVYLYRSRLTRKALLWLIPISGIALSMGLYTNPFTKGISLFVLPVSFFIFVTHEVHENIRKTLWSKYAIFDFFSSGAHYINSVLRSFGFFSFKKCSWFLPQLSENKKDILKQVGLGLLVLAIVANWIVIPLLSSADIEFARTLKDFVVVIDAVKQQLAYITRVSFLFR